MANSAKSRANLGHSREAVRQHNLSAVLGLVHQAGEITRSQLTQITALNRSTISDLVEQLEDLGLVTETESLTREGIGRPSLMVSASDDVIALSVHPELDFLGVAAISLSGKFVVEERVTYQPGVTAQTVVKEAARLISKVCEQLDESSKIIGIGVAVPGQVRIEDGVVRLAPHLGWVEVPFAKMLEQVTGFPVFLDNDASLGSLAERMYGAARNFQDIVYLWGGSGIGGGVVHNGMQLRGSAGYAGELGHVRISDKISPDYSGLQGTLEALVRREDILKALNLGLVDDKELETALLSNRTAAVRELIERQIDVLAAAIGNYVNIFNPQIIVLGGFLSALFWYDQERLLQSVRQASLDASREGVIVRTAELGSNNLLVGAAELAFAELVTDPAAYTLRNTKARIVK